MALITISRQSGSLGEELADYLADKLSCPVVTRDYAMKNFFGQLQDGVIARLNESAKFFLEKIPGSGMTFRDVIISKLNETADEYKDSNLIVLGLGGFYVLGKRPQAVNIRVYASEETRVARIARKYNISSEEAGATLAIGDRKHKRFVSILYDSDTSSVDHYDLSLNTDRLSVEEMGAAVLALCGRHDLRSAISSETAKDDSIDHQSEAPVFKNPTEEEFAKILNMYNIEWMYEPKTFPIEWDAEGNIKMAFSPDFYLPKFDLYLELTTMDQKYVTKKNKKLRMVRELYPGVNIKIVYKRDFQELAERLKGFGG